MAQIQLQIFNIEVDEESNYYHVFYITDPSTGLPVDISTWTAQMRIAPKYQGIISTQYDADISTGVTLTLGNLGTLSISMAPISTSAKTWTEGVYDIFLTDTASIRTKVVRGSFLIKNSITKLSQT